MPSVIPRTRTQGVRNARSLTHGDSSGLFVGNTGDLVARFARDGAYRTLKAFTGGTSQEFNVKSVRQYSCSPQSTGQNAVLFLPNERTVFQELDMYVDAVDAFGLDPSGTSDCTTQVQNAIASGELLFIQSGTYLIDPDAALTLDERGVIGESTLSPSVPGTVFKPSHAVGAGSILMSVGDGADLRGLTFDCDGKCDIALYSESSSSVLNTIVCINANDAGFLHEAGILNAMNLLVQGNAVTGCRIVGANGGTIYKLIGHTNATGLEVTGGNSGTTYRFGAHAGSAVTAGDVTIIGGGFDGSTVNSVHYKGVIGGALRDLHLEGGGFDGILMDSATTGVSVSGHRIIGTSPGVAVRLTSANRCSFRDLKANSDTDGFVNTGFKRIVITTGGANPSFGNTFSGCWRESNVLREPMTLVYDNGAGTVWLADVDESGLIRGNTAPTTGNWFPGMFIKNRASASGQPNGWSNSVAGAPGTWKPEANTP